MKAVGEVAVKLSADLTRFSLAMRRAAYAGERLSYRIQGKWHRSQMVGAR